MTNDHEHLEPLESALGELADAERASVFAATPVKAEELIARARTVGPTILKRRRLAWLSAAAVIALATGVWTLMFQHEFDKLRGRSGVVARNTLHGGGEGPCDGNFINCFSGPQPVLLASRCHVHDYDADGDVDLADFRDYQIHCNRPPSITR